MRARMCALLVVGVVMALLPVVAGAVPGGPSGPRAAPVAGPDFRISGGAGYEEWTRVAWNEADGEYLVVWRDNRDYGTRGWDVYGRRVGADGTPIGSDFRINGGGAVSSQVNPAVAWNSTDDEYLVVWQDGRNEPTREQDIYGRLLGADGVPVGGDFRVCGPAAKLDEYEPAVAWNNEAGEYLVVWRDQRNTDTRRGDIYGRRVGADGTLPGGDFRISGKNAIAYDLYPEVAWNPTTDVYLVVWHDERNQATRKQDIYGRLVGPDGARVGGDRRISGGQALGMDLYPAVVANVTSGEFLVAWQDGRAATTRGHDIYARVVAGDGSPLGADFRVNSAKTLTYQEWPAAAWDETDNTYVVVWQDDRNSDVRFNDVYGRLVRGDGWPLETDFRISGPDAIAPDLFPAVAWNSADDEYLVVWADGRNEATSGGDIFGRLLSG